MIIEIIVCNYILHDLLAIDFNMETKTTSFISFKLKYKSFVVLVGNSLQRTFFK